ncbi:MAG: hypothetical protein HN855_05905 [Anaerolineae bacterium]|jgi:MraZ protein|nr:hypothetical protein [Anaerolineae bacterium]MBT7072715.1 hypothetical protein [Anaerolineae bacterium]MBT7324674.1 hypothetical protein [Anaerolineae bacterium]
MFYGQHTTQVSASKTFSLPEDFLSDINDDLFITQGFDRNLIIMPENVFVELYQRVTSMNMADPLARLLLRLFLGNATLIPRNSSHEVTLSEQLLKYAELLCGDMAILVGQGDHLELWAQGHWEEQKVDLLDVSKNAYRFSSLNLSV